MKVRISRRALVQRINRKLAQRDERLKSSRGVRARQDCGNYWILNVRRNFVADRNIDPEQLARELGVLQPFEALEDA